MNPTRSQKRAVTTLRSSATGRAGAASSGEPHPLQNSSPSGFSVPQEGHAVIGGAYAMR